MFWSYLFSVSDKREAQQFLAEIEKLLKLANGLVKHNQGDLSPEEVAIFNKKHIELDTAYNELSIKLDGNDQTKKVAVFSTKIDKEKFYVKANKLRQDCIVYRRDALTASQRAQRSAVAAQLSYRSEESLQAPQPDTVTFAVPMQTPSLGDDGEDSQSVATITRIPQAILPSQTQTPQNGTNGYYQMLVRIYPDRCSLALDSTLYSDDGPSNEAAEKALAELSQLTTEAMAPNPTTLEAHQIATEDSPGSSIVRSMVSALVANIPTPS